MGLFTGVDLHSNNGYYGIINEDEEQIFKKKLPNHLPTVLSNLEPFREDIVGIVVESTYNWYWLVDGLMEEGLFLNNKFYFFPFFYFHFASL